MEERHKGEKMEGGWEKLKEGRKERTTSTEGRREGRRKEKKMKREGGKNECSEGEEM